MRSMKSRKAPGNDMIYAKMLKHAVKGEFLGVITNLMNGCHKLGVFPSSWKQGVVQVLLIGADKDPAATKSYQPICLLSIISEVLKRLIKHRLTSVLSDPQHASPDRYGFRRGRCTEDAVARLLKTAKGTEDGMCLALLFDVTGAFDNLKWDSILAELRKRECPLDMYNFVRDYLSERSVKLEELYQKVGMSIHKGCPQGSILGPDFWNICLDPLLLAVRQQGGDIIAYADGLVLIVKGTLPAFRGIVGTFGEGNLRDVCRTAGLPFRQRD